MLLRLIISTVVQFFDHLFLDCLTLVLVQIELSWHIDDHLLLLFEHLDLFGCLKSIHWLLHNVGLLFPMPSLIVVVTVLVLLLLHLGLRLWLGRFLIALSVLFVLLYLAQKRVLLHSNLLVPFCDYHLWRRTLLLGCHHVIGLFLVIAVGFT